MNPEPGCYLYAKKVLGLSNPIAFEDTQISMEAAVRAGNPCVAAPSEWATKQDFSKAVEWYGKGHGLSMICTLAHVPHGADRRRRGSACECARSRFMVVRIIYARGEHKVSTG